MKFLILLSLAVAMHAASPPGPPVFDKSFQGASFSVSVGGTWPTTYQWYRVGAIWDSKVLPPAGIQRELSIKPTDPAGLYYCIATNAAGSSKSPLFRLSYTSAKTASGASAADMAVTIKVP